MPAQPSRLAAMPRFAGITVLLFGVTSLFAGTRMLLFPQQGIASLDLPDDAVPAIKAMSLAAVAMYVGPGRHGAEVVVRISCRGLFDSPFHHAMR